MIKSPIRYLLISLPILTQPAYGYIDPGTGSMLLQGLLAAVAAAVVTIRLYWQRIKTFFSGRKNAKPPPDETPGEGDST